MVFYIFAIQYKQDDFSTNCTSGCSIPTRPVLSSSITKAGKDDQVDQEQTAHGEHEKDGNVDQEPLLEVVNMTILMGCREGRGPYLVPAKRPAMTIGLAATRATSVGSESSTSLKEVGSKSDCNRHGHFEWQKHVKPWNMQ